MRYDSFLCFTIGKMAVVNRVARSAHKFFVGRLRWTVDAGCLQKHFEKFGGVVHSKVMFDMKTGHSRRFGFVIMSDDAARDRVLAESRHRIEGQMATVRLFVDKNSEGTEALSASTVPEVTQKQSTELEDVDYELSQVDVTQELHPETEELHKEEALDQDPTNKKETGV